MKLNEDQIEIGDQTENPVGQKETTRNMGSPHPGCGHLAASRPLTRKKIRESATILRR